MCVLTGIDKNKLEFNKIYKNKKRKRSLNGELVAHRSFPPTLVKLYYV